MSENTKNRLYFNQTWLYYMPISKCVVLFAHYKKSLRNYNGYE